MNLKGKIESILIDSNMHLSLDEVKNITDRIIAVLETKKQQINSELALYIFSDKETK